MTVTAPASAAIGPPQPVKVDWAGLASGTKYLGAVSHSGATLLGLTVVSVSTD
jgi:hypothetical protein